MKRIFVSLAIALFFLSSCSSPQPSNSFRIAPESESKWDFIYAVAYFNGHGINAPLMNRSALPTLIGDLDKLSFDPKGEYPFQIQGMNNEDMHMKNVPFSNKVIEISYKDSRVYIANSYDVGMHRRYPIAVTGSIVDSEIILDKGVRVGMTKDDVLPRLFNRSMLSKYSGLIEKSDTIPILDNWFILTHNYIFEGDKLKEVRVDYK